MHQNMQKEHAAALENNYVMLNEVWEPLVESKTTEDLGAEPELVHKLLNWFWIWQYPLHNYLYRPCFIMDMALGGPYYSKFLLHCILALSARHLETESPDNEVAQKGESFLSSAKELLMHELGATKPKIPTIQGLLVLSGRQCAVGKTSEGWLYLGMAIRMMTDLGLHLNFQELMHLEKLTPVELEVRKRLYCSAYIWDKSMSLSLGRPPALSKLPSSALEFLDHADDQYLWLPPDYPDYPNTDTYQTTCFQFFCRLGTIIELIMLPFPSRPSAVALKERQSRIENKLRLWLDDLPTGLKMATDCEVCPPPHILSLNLLYHSLHIILWRPYLDRPETASHATNVCINSAQTVHDMFIVYGRTFHWKKMSYLVSYCVYTAATVQVHEMRSTDMRRRQDATKRLAMLLQILESELRQTPGIRRSIDIIKRQLRSWTPNRAPNASTADDATIAPGEETTRQGKSSLPLGDQTLQAPSNAALVPNTEGPNEQLLPQPQVDSTNAWAVQYDQMSDVASNDFGFGFVDTSAGFYLPWSMDDAPSFNFFGTQTFDTTF
ncbi:hypothetical protein M409DRAFT_29401 [Zasmidium cellare ATCC 36951]|uniref:Xylanolytic transcriptional activator regulatory domain-containing protein n=1 Tax=Zasmidium cellare ATCC 36951 TaxID=1080233 RepID=A0A6A6BZ76_ZASCE|nr:uncharacterized protein M409DRAFT_29401 [Zasmidium cellare ATCC 36951]KAF2160104.1 hypothetical protein M409DRAFT_29401 [Zasmidium cellare ATCC 36951]